MAERDGRVIIQLHALRESGLIVKTIILHPDADGKVTNACLATGLDCVGLNVKMLNETGDWAE